MRNHWPGIPATPALWGLISPDGRGDDSAGSVIVDERSETSDGSGGNALVCRFCGTRITTSGARTRIGGKHHHVFFNPSGLIFEVGCFSAAQGLLFGGPASLEFTWFPGYAWQPVACSGCLEHLGWHYSGFGTGFFGLILTSLREVSDDASGEG
ncbi:hypothetical protein GGQ74_000411 [Desulfobaculum xiamenense]|uniref:CULT domain-containing protein n=1 Tax=Desulfobaculum xiamenense TaxID=995050 RepID=A0A846QES7_9BACT|nr:cereblon family protein [Desulfobaculum xiamenense]NJB66771.1 hypothetical protein [Desulfobaculum xiamenense]